MKTLEKIKQSVHDVVWRQFGLIASEEDVNRVIASILEPLKHPDEGMVEAMGQTPGMKEVDEIIAFCAARNSAHILSYMARGEDAPLIQAWKAAIEYIQKGGG